MSKLRVFVTRFETKVNYDATILTLFIFMFGLHTWSITYRITNNIIQKCFI